VREKPWARTWVSEEDESEGYGLKGGGGPGGMPYCPLLLSSIA